VREKELFPQDNFGLKSINFNKPMLPKENDVLPQTLESWIYLGVACFIGIFIGQWIRKRRNKTEAASEALSRMQSTHQRKRISKKSRRKNQRLSQ
jgi:hypothetical protein